ncbi:MAG: PP2C family protein-serine/threonine phosphatase [Sarcina sp.]
MNYVVAYSSYIGMRVSNQDAMLIKTTSVEGINLGFFVMCDGLGGLNYGEVASSNVIKYLNRWFDNEKHNLIRQRDEEIEYNLKEAINYINRKIIDYSQGCGLKIGTTLTLMLNIGEKVYCCHIGDCRIYEVGEEVLRRTKDHTLVQREIDIGLMTEQQARRDKRKNILLQCIGVKEDIKIDFFKWSISNEKIYLLCSDGFYKLINEMTLKDEFIKVNKFSEEFLKEKVEYFIDKVLENGEKDNISVIAFAVG